ncbi:hypothetical protein ABT56_09640 [Photobacterium aquae]|uniref:Uncharacterized protein n=1 Tax=Photobacterium aquae TaxID=1195763 RepID=A0A0J1H3E3_9GAMM|nr:hypothetical protein ABT56_09640 [Photobacterium aquae]
MGLLSVSLLFSGSLAAAEPRQCDPQWHNTMSLDDGKLELGLGGETFSVRSDGRLYFGVHPVKLNEQQMEVLANYHQMMLDDLPYTLSHNQHIDDEFCQRVAARQIKENEIQSLIPALKRWQSVTLD